MSFYYRRKLRKIGKALLEASEKVELYRGDVLTKEALNEQLELALADLQKVAERDRSNADVHAEIALCRSALKLQKKRDDEFRSAFRGSMKQEPTSFLTNVSESINGILCNVLGKDAFSLLGQCGGLRPSSKRPSHNN